MADSSRRLRRISKNSSQIVSAGRNLQDVGSKEHGRPSRHPWLAETLEVRVGNGSMVRNPDSG